MKKTATTPEAAYALAAGKKHTTYKHAIAPIGSITVFACPYCEALTQQEWGVFTQAAIFPSESSISSRGFYGMGAQTLAAAKCTSCQRETIFLGGKVIAPQISPAPMPHDDMPAELKNDYLEARSIVSASPRGAAALLRLAIQKLCPIIGATKPDINSAIGELVANGTISGTLQQALDSVRVIGNEAVHPGELDLNDDPETAHALFGLINFIIEKAITEPRQIGELYQSLPAKKLAGIAQRDAAQESKA